MACFVPSSLLRYRAPPGAGQSGSLVISSQYAALGLGQTMQFTQSGPGGAPVEWLVNGVVGGSSATGTVNGSGSYIAPATVSQIENVAVTVALAASPQQNYATSVVAIIAPAQVTCPFQLGNPLVAQYSLYLPSPGQLDVQFGTATTYGLNPSETATPSANGGEIQTYVTGMRGLTVYHMRARLTLSNGATYNDSDHARTTDVPPVTSTVSASTTSEATPSCLPTAISKWISVRPSKGPSCRNSIRRAHRWCGRQPLLKPTNFTSTGCRVCIRASSGSRAACPRSRAFGDMGR